MEVQRPLNLARRAKMCIFHCIALECSRVLEEDAAAALADDDDEVGAAWGSPAEWSSRRAVDSRGCFPQQHRRPAGCAEEALNARSGLRHGVDVHGIGVVVVVPDVEAAPRGSI